MRTPWIFDNYEFPVNPYDDSGWNNEIIISEKNPIYRNGSIFQDGGSKSYRRTVRGYLFGPKAMEQKAKMEYWKNARIRAALKDHIGEVRRGQLLRFTPKPINDVRAYQLGRASFEYEAEWVEV